MIYHNQELLLQTCYIDMAMGSLDSTTVDLIPGKMVMSQPREMVLFTNVKWSLDRATFGNGKNGIRMKIVMKRKITSEMMTTYFPTLLLTMITFATTFFKPFFFEAALSVNLTTMLVMTTIFLSNMEILPSTSDIKMVDIWLILCQMVPFAEVVLLTAMEYQREDKTEKKTKKKKKGRKKSKKNKHSKSLSIHIVSEADNQDHMNDDDLEQPREPTLQMTLGENDEDNLEQKCYQRCWIPDLKTTGRCFFYLAMAEYILTIILSEKRVLPCLVLASYIVYFAIALNFYFDY